jgi:hypothetical protein
MWQPVLASNWANLRAARMASYSFILTAGYLSVIEMFRQALEGWNVNQRIAFCTDVATTVLQHWPHPVICKHFPASG